jgi:hypothetical protein
MSNIEFTEEKQENVRYGRFEPSNTTPKLVRLVMKLGLAKTKKQANYVLMAVTLISFILAIYFFATGGPPRRQAATPPPGAAIGDSPNP